MLENLYSFFNSHIMVYVVVFVVKYGQQYEQYFVSVVAGGIHKINCSNCDNVCIGQTRRKIDVTLK